MNERQTQADREPLIRVFCALLLESTTVSSLHNALLPIQKQMSGFRWTEPKRWHITLRFYGNLSRGLAQAVADAIATLPHASIPITLRGIGVFPNSQKGRVAWVGVHDSGTALQTLYRTVEDISSDLGIPGGDRPFRPHLTIGRAQRGHHPQIPGDILGTHSPLINTALNQLVLLHSEPRPTGPVYTRIEPMNGPHSLCS
jgi:2'-5' RNA ligase